MSQRKNACALSMETMQNGRYNDEIYRPISPPLSSKNNIALPIPSKNSEHRGEISESRSPTAKDEPTREKEISYIDCAAEEFMPLIFNGHVSFQESLATHRGDRLIHMFTLGLPFDYDDHQLAHLRLKEEDVCS